MKKSMLLTLVVALAVSGAAIDPLQWRELGVNYTAPSNGDAYYPSIIFDINSFGTGVVTYKMWYSDGTGNAYMVSSPDGIIWNAPTQLQGFAGNIHHVQVLYDTNGFGTVPSTNKYRIWYWDTNFLYNISAIACAESIDGVNWVNIQAITQDNILQLVTGISPNWNCGSYGPVCVFYNASGFAIPNGSNVFGNRFVLYYDGTTGGQERVGLAYSVDGKHWFFAAGPVLDVGPESWDANYSGYGTVFREGTNWHFWFSGGNGATINGVTGGIHEGIGYASSTDGITWTKNLSNPIFKWQSIAYRWERSYTPSVLRDQNGMLRMYFSVKENGGKKKIALAINVPPLYDTVYVNNWATQPFLSQVFFPGLSTPHYMGLDAFTKIQDAISAVSSEGTVNVAPGNYLSTNTLLVQKPVTLQSSAGPNTTTIQGDPNNPYVIEISASNVTINGFTLTNPNYNGGSDPSGIVIDDGTNSNIRITNNIIHDTCTPTRSPASFGTTGIVMGPVSNVEVDHNIIYNIHHGSSDMANGGAAGIVLWGNSASNGPCDITIHDNTIYGISSPRDDAGIRLDQFTQNVIIQNNTIIDSSEYGIWIEPNQINAPLIQYNSISGTVLGLDNRSSLPIDATNNWWGHSRGPQHTMNVNTGTGAKISNGITFSPWLGDGTDTQPAIPGFQPNLAPMYAIPTHLVFTTQPESAYTGTPLVPQPTITAEDTNGFRGINFESYIVLMLSSNPTQGILTGTVSILGTDGQASFNDLSVNTAGEYQLEAMAFEVAWTVSTEFTVSNPIPSIKNLSPTTTPAGLALMLFITGTGFVQNTKVYWNDTDIPTTYNSSTELVAFIPSYLVEAGTTSIKVINPEPGGGTNIAMLTITNAIVSSYIPVIESISVTPNPALVGQNVSFVVLAHDQSGQTVMVLWDFGDGTTAMGNSVIHTYSAPTTYYAVATFANPQGGTATNVVTVVIVAVPLATEPLTIIKKRLRAKNPSIGKDTCRLSGSLVLPMGVSSLSGSMQTDIGGLDIAFTLDNKGRGKNGSSTFKLKSRVKKGVFLTQMVQFYLKATGDFQRVLNTANLTPGTSGNVTVRFTFGSKVYFANMPLIIKGTTKNIIGN